MLTAGEDECLRIWDTAFNLIHEVNLRRIGILDVPQVLSFLAYVLIIHRARIYQSRVLMSTVVKALQRMTTTARKILKKKPLQNQLSFLALEMVIY